VKGVETDVDIVLHNLRVCVVLCSFGSVLVVVCSRMKGILALHLLDYKQKILLLYCNKVWCFSMVCRYSRSVRYN
jgi:hypothetical protein